MVGCTRARRLLPCRLAAWPTVPAVPPTGALVTPLCPARTCTQHRLLHEPGRQHRALRQHLQGAAPAAEVRGCAHARAKAGVPPPPCAWPPPPSCPLPVPSPRQVPGVAGRLGGAGGRHRCRPAGRRCVRLPPACRMASPPGTRAPAHPAAPPLAPCAPAAMLHCATTPACANQAFNISNGDCFRCAWGGLLPQLSCRCHNHCTSLLPLACLTSRPAAAGGRTCGRPSPPASTCPRRRRCRSRWSR